MFIILEKRIMEKIGGADETSTPHPSSPIVARYSVKKMCNMWYSRF